MLDWFLDVLARLWGWIKELLGSHPGAGLRAYAVTEIPPLGGLASSANDINDRSDVVGSAQVATGQVHGYSWDGGTMFDLGGFPGPDQSSAYAINNQGFIGGQSQLPPAGNDTHAYVVPPATKIAPAHDLGTLGGANSVVIDLSIDHIAVGWADVPNGQLHAFVRRHGGPMLDLTPALAGTSSAEAVDSAGRVAGWTTGGGGVEAFRWTQSTGLVAIHPPGASFSRAFGIIYQNALVVGEADFGAGAHAAVWDKNNVATDLGTLGGPTSVAYDVNEGGDVVGASDVPGGARHAFLVTAGGPMVDLNTLIPANSGWVLDEARAINRQGQIVGNGTLNGKARGFLLT